MTFSFLLLLSLIYLLFAHVFIPNIGGVLLHPREYVIWILLCGMVSLSVVKVLREERVTLPEGRVAFLVFVLLSVVSVFFNPILNRELFLIQSVHLIAIYFLWVAFSQFWDSRAVRDRVFLIIFLSTLIEAIIGILQFFGIYRFVPITPIEGEGFVWGVFQQKNLFGSFIAVGLVLSLYLISSPVIRTGSLRKLLLSFSPAFLGPALVFANSRTAWIGFLSGAVVLVLSRLSIYRNVRTSLAVWFLTFTLGVIGGVWLYGGSEDYREALIKRESSNAQRVLMLLTSWKMFKERPLTGWGFGNFASLYMHKQAEVADEYFKRFIGGFVSHPHNEIANIAVQSGLLGLAGLLTVVSAFIRILWRLGIRKASFYTAVLLPFIVHSLLEFPLELSVIHYTTFIIFLSMMSSHRAKRVSLELNPYIRRTLYVGSALFFFGSSLWFLITFRDYMRMTLFVVERDRERFRPELLEGARKNPYLKLWADVLFMTERVKEAIKNREVSFLEEFVNWSYAYRRKLPLYDLYLLEATSLMILGEEYKNLAFMDESMKVVEEGLKLYPNGKELSNLKGVILAKSVRIFVDYLRGDEYGKE